MKKEDEIPDVRRGAMRKTVIVDDDDDNEDVRGTMKEID